MAGIGALAVVLACSAAGMRVNTSRSIPLGLYWTSSGPPVRGVYVFFCPPETNVMAEAKGRGYLAGGPCPGDYGYMMKKVAAASGDAIAISALGVSMNGSLLPFSAVLPSDGTGRPLKPFHRPRFVLQRTELLLMSDVSATSFDGRYFGPVKRAQIRSVIVPVFTW